MMVIALPGCKTSYEDQSADLSNYVSKHRIGSSPDVYLVKRNMIGEWERVALIYGFAPDYEFCQETAGLYMAKYPASEYSCQIAN